MEEVKKSNKSTYIIAFMIIGILIVLYLIGVILFRGYIINKAHREVKEIIISELNGDFFMEYKGWENTNDTQEIKRRLEISEKYVQNQIKDLKTKGEITSTETDMKFYCRNGEIEYYHPDQGNLCGGGINKTEEIGYKNFTIKNNSIITLSTESLVLFLLNGVYYELEEIENMKKNEENIAGATLDLLRLLSNNIVLWQSIRESLSSGFNETNIIQKNPKKAIEGIQNINDEMTIPNENEIEELELKQACIDKMKSVKNKNGKKYLNNQRIDKLITSSFLDRIIWINYKIEPICEKVIDLQKRNAIKILEDNKNERNPFLSIERKLYLNSIVQCPQGWFSSGDCRDKILKNFEKDMKKKLKVKD